MNNQKFLNLEQPNSQNINSQGEEILQKAKSENCSDIKGVELDVLFDNFQSEDGSKLGKFKNTDSLLQSYNNLQSDYTKKCQALAELQKQVEEENKQKEEQKKLDEKLSSLADEFFANNLRAKKYESELIKLIAEDKDILQTQNPFSSAWQKFVTNNFFSAEELASDEKFLQKYIFNNENIKNKIVSDYFSKLKINNSPILISNQKGSKTMLSPANKPKTIGEASKLVEELFS